MNQDWQPVTTGTLNGLVRRWRFQRRILPTTGIVSLVLLIGTWSLSQWQVSTEVPRLSCGECIKLLPDYLDETLSPRWNTAVKLHLEHCSGCRSQIPEYAVKRNRVSVAGHFDLIRSTPNPDQIIAQ